MIDTPEMKAAVECKKCAHFWNGPFGNSADCLKYSAWKASVTAEDMRRDPYKCGPNALSFQALDAAREEG